MDYLIDHGGHLQLPHVWVIDPHTVRELVGWGLIELNSLGPPLRLVLIFLIPSSPA
jgi:hypothetical protein